MKRKVIKQGHNTLTITLPSKWAEKNKITYGKEVEIEEKDNKLIIHNGTPSIDLKEITVNISGLLPRLADRFMARAYQKGYDKIILNYDNPDLMIAVKNKVNELMGYEVMDVSKNSIHISCISSQLNIDFNNALRKAIILMMNMAETCLSAYQTNNKVELENLKQYDYDVNRFLYFCLRYINKSDEHISFGSSILYYLVESLEDLGDELKELGHLLAQTHRKNDDIISLIKKMNEMFRISYDFFYKPEKNKAVSAFVLYQEIKKLLDKALETRNIYETKAIIAIDFSVRIIYHLTTMRLDTLKELSG